MQELFRWGAHVVLREEDKTGRFLVCFPCGYSFENADNLAVHLDKEHVLGLGLREIILAEQEWLDGFESASDAIA